ncbi:unnamed protein product [Callosobruchus maculatus]|nr:unnamed protein product [Callosobruchus maculatus]
MPDGIKVINDTHLKLEPFFRVIPKSSACLDETTRGGFIVRICENIEICEKTKCVHKCCPDGQSFVNGSRCKSTWIHGIDLHEFSNEVENYQDEFATVHGYSPLYPILRSMKYQLDNKGTFFVRDGDGNRTYYSSERSYCFEHATKGGRILGYVLFRFFPDVEDVPLNTKFLVNRWAMMVSGVFLVVTILFYIFTEETKKVFGKCLVSLCFALLILFVMLAAYIPFKKKLLEKRHSHICKTIGKNS